MPERWERELEKLRHVHVDRARVEERVALGQRGGSVRHRERWLNGVVAAIIAIAAIAIVWQLSPTRGQKVGSSRGVVVVTVGHGGAPATMSFGDRMQSGTPGTGHLAEDQELVGVLAQAEDVSAYLPVPAATPVEFEVGDNQIVTVLLGWKHDGGDWEMLAQMGGALDRAILSDRTFRSGSFVLQVIGKSPEGRWFDFSFGIEIVPETSSSSSPAPTPSPSESIDDGPWVLIRIEGLGRSDRSRDFPVITMSYRGATKRGCTQAFRWTLADGTEIEGSSGGSGGLPICSYDPVFRLPPGIPITIEVPTAVDVFATRTMTPFYEGSDAFGASVRWPDGSGDFTVPFDVVGEAGTRQILLACPTEDRVDFFTPDGPRITPGGSAYIRGNMVGFQQTDVIEQMTREPGGATEWDGVWQVVRDGSVVATVDFQTLRGVACRGSGIGGV